ncbi:uncharacterized protein LOC114282486 [Camellia sinensis]|uniref:uncharacterized protein LOC114282486 n=1 Tax=Camellia sinensis TaxID=4442 RepID=UPI001035CBBE|nr:uncharacterized protein LOC114282486 [Camellia sinensis]
MLNGQSKEEILKNRIRVKATTETIQVLALQGLGFRGHDESSISFQGNLIELLKFKARGNDALESIILKNAPQNAKYTSLKIQKEILHILANRVKNVILMKFQECLGELKSFHKSEVENMLAGGERQSSKGANQIGTLHRAGAIRWSSHYDSVNNLIDMYEASCKTQDILNVMKLVSTTKTLLQKLRQDDWDIFLANVVSFCNRHNVAVHDMSSPYEEGTSRCRQQNHITIEHHYHFDIFNSTIDFQLMELEHRFNDGIVELLSLSSALDPSGNFRSFNVENICNLTEKFYP